MYQKSNFDLERFMTAQNGCYQDVIKELTSGRKLTHWMWYIFPQIQGLGMTSTSKFYAINSLSEANAYLRHPVLSSRIEECLGLVMNYGSLRVKDIFGYPDDLKFHSSLTLFSLSKLRTDAFEQALNVFFKGQVDKRTMDILKLQRPNGDGFLT